MVDFCETSVFVAIDTLDVDSCFVFTISVTLDNFALVVCELDQVFDSCLVEAIVFSVETLSVILQLRCNG